MLRPVHLAGEVDHSNPLAAFQRSWVTHARSVNGINICALAGHLLASLRLREVGRMDKIFEDKLNAFESILDSIRGTRHFSFECGNGWYPAIHASLSFASKRNEEKQLGLRIIQVKEKFAGLRIYHRGGDEQVEACFSAASVIAGSMCDVCSRLGYADNQGGWVAVRCEEHRGLPARDLSDAYILDEQFVDGLSEAIELLVREFGSGAAQWLLKAHPGLGGEQPLAIIIEEQSCARVLSILGRE